MDGIDLFISHSSADASIARDVRSELEAAGYTCWMAPDDVTGIEPWAQQILDAIHKSRAMLVLVSSNSNRSTHVSREVNLATGRNLALVPVRIEAVGPEGALEYHLAGLQRIDVFPPPISRHRDRMLRRLAQTVPPRLSDLRPELTPYDPVIARGLQLPQVPSSAPSEERKVVSVLFCDLVALQPGADAADPEDARARMEPYHERIRTDVERFGGTFERLAGDAFLAAFGAPTTHEDDSERAVRAGLRILETLDDLNNEDPSLVIQARIGIATGEALVTQGARPEWGERIVTGHVVNVASRLPSDAAAGAVLVAEDTYRATRDVFDYQPLEAPSVEGLGEPVQIWWAKAARSRFGSDIVHTHATPLVGRELERTLLQGVYERAVRDSSVQLVTIVGEPGIGKTRLVAELASYVDAKDELVRWRQGRCLPYGEGITFWALGEIVKAEAGILDSDSMALAAEKLDTAVPADEPDREWLKARLAPLVGTQPGPPAEREEAFTAWRRFLEGMVATGPAVLVFEDLHWADEALLGFLEYLADWSEGGPLLLLCTARPELYERRKDWAGGKRNTTTISLPLLSDEETSQLVSALLDGADLPARTRQTVLERAGGNPLYAEEFVRLLRDRGSIDQVGQMVDGQVPLPASLQALIAARLDTLPAERKAMLQDAAVVGKVFWASTLATMAGRDVAGVRTALHELSRKELVRSSRVSSMEGEAEYAFWHALVRDVAYGQIPRAARAAKHQAAAAWIEKKAGERVEDLADVLAYHYGMALELTQAGGKKTVAAELAGPARQFLVLAGDRALALDVDQAAAHFAKALALAPPGDPARSSILVRWADAIRQTGQLVEAAAVLEEAIADLRGRGDVLATGRALSLLSSTLYSMDAVRATEFATEAVRLLESVQPSGELVDAYAEMAGDEMIHGAPREAIDWAQRALGLARDLGLPEPARAQGFLGSARCNLGDAGGLEDTDRALRLAIDQGHGRDAAVMYGNMAVAVLQIEGAAAGLRIQRAGIEFAERRGISELARSITAGTLEPLLWLGRWDEVLEIAASFGDRPPELSARRGIRVTSIEARVHLDRGEIEQAADLLEGLEDKARATGDPQDAPSVFAVAGLANLAQGQTDRASGLLAELDGLPNLRETPDFLSWLPDLVRLSIDCDRLALADWFVAGVQPLHAQHQHAVATASAALSEARRDLADAAVTYAEAAAGWREFGNVPERARALLGQGRCLLELGQPDSVTPLKQARAIFRTLGASPLVANTDALLARAIALGEPVGRKHGQKAATDST